MSDLHRDSIVLDLHNHACLKQGMMFRGLGSKEERFLASLFKRAFWPLSARSTFPKMVEGGLDVVLSTNYIPEKEWLDHQKLIKFVLFFADKTKKKVFDPNYFDATINMMDEMEKEIEEWNDCMPERQIKVVLNSTELQETLDDPENPIAVVHSVEGAHSLEGDLADEEEILGNLQKLSDRGVAYLTLAHFYENKCAYPVFPYPEYGISSSNWKKLLGAWDMTKGISEIGEKVVEKMLELNMLIDISHCTPSGRKRIYDIVDYHQKQECLLASHTGAFELNPDPYNLEDWEIKWFADHGCVVGVIFMNYWISQVDSALGLKNIERTFNHIKKVGGSDVPAIGTDFDGFTDPPDEIIDVSQMPRITNYLEALRYDSEDIEKFLGKNGLRLLKNGWKP